GWVDVLKLAGKFTVQRILERDDFSRRLKEGREILVHETLYPLMQAYDSVKVKADVEIGGTDQKFNMLAGRDLQRKTNMPEQDVLTVPLLVGVDGVKKMSKSAGNYIALGDEPNAMFGKIMSVPDSLISHYAELAAFLPAEELEKIKKNLKDGKNPRDEKIKVAEAVTALYHGEKAGRNAAEEFIKVFSKKEIPAEMPEISASKNKMNILDLLSLTKRFSSKSEAKRVVEQKGAELDGRVLTDWKEEAEFKNGAVLKIGKKKFFKIKIK
ncbi:MAG: tyrosine--tRNA ligase, partial [Patescibacteria group bacterium]